MSTGISVYLANKWLDLAFRGIAWTPPTAIYAKGHLGDPGGAGTNNPSAQTARYATTFAAAAAGAIAMNNTPEVTLNATENLSHVSFWDTAGPAGGNFLFSAQASVVKGGAAGDIIRIYTNTITFGNIAA